MNGNFRTFSSIKLLAIIVTFAALLQGCSNGLLTPTDGSISQAPELTDDFINGLQEQYVLQTGDQIFIQVFNDDDLTMKATVGQSGSINYSYLGAVQVEGLTAEQLAESITAKLADGYLRNPSVNITIERYGSFFVNGEVQRPGSYSFEPGLTLAKAVSLAGGMTDRASRNKYYLIREVANEKKTYLINLSQKIQPGDVITIGEGVF